MSWTEETTEQYLREHGMPYRKYRTVRGMDILDYKSSPSVCLLRYGHTGDSASHLRMRDGVPTEVIEKTIAAELDSDTLIIQSDNVFVLTSRNGCTGDAQVGGTLEGFITYLGAWASMANTPGPFATA